MHAGGKGASAAMRHRRLRHVVVSTILALLLVVPASASQFGGEQVHPENPPPWELGEAPGDSFAANLWFVEFASPPAVRGGSPAAHANERAHLNAEARQEGVEFAERGNFTTLWNGMSVQIDFEDVGTLQSLTSVAAVYPVALVERPDPASVSPDLATALTMTGADTAQSELGYSGDGVSVAIIDSGIDYNHLDLGGSGDHSVVIEANPNTRVMDHPRVTNGWDYVGDDFDASVPGATPQPNPDPMDRNGHGTHVAGIVGANTESETGVTGVAPDVTFGAYKVFGDQGPTTADVIVEALEDAYVDGMDVVNMSLGAVFVWGQEEPLTAASNELAAQGVVVVNSAGNSGAAGMYTLSSPANGHDIISVASADNIEFQANFFTVEQLAEPVPFMELDGAEMPPTEGESNPLSLPAPSTIDEQTGFFGCAPGDFDGFTQGNVALVERGFCTFATKYLNAAAAGASGVVIFNNAAGMFGATILDDGIDGVWGAAIARADGLALAALVLDPDADDVVLGFTDETMILPNPTGGLVSSFSSYGQDVELAFGPSVMAPGGLIRSTVPGGGYAIFSGTSMSAPHVAGAVALLLEAEPDLDPFQVRDRLQNTAEPAPWSLNPGAGFLDHTFRQGAGMIQIDRAITAEQRVTPAQIAVGDATSVVVELTVVNDGENDVTYSIGHTGTLGASISTYAPVFLLPGSTVDSPETVTVSAGGSANVSVTIFAPGFGIPNHQYGGYIELVPDNGSGTLRVPYVGYDGDYQELPLLGFFAPIVEDGFVVGWELIEREPRLAQIIYDEDGQIDDFEPVHPGHQFTVRDGDFPAVEVFFGHYPHEMRMYAIHQPSGREHLIYLDRYLPRSPGPNDYYGFIWPGGVQAGASENARSVPSGTYTFRVEVLRALGDPANPDHWEVWESPAFQVDTRRGGPGSGRGQGPGQNQGQGRGR
jgi:minor extracellular serine protease Vpr